MRFSAGRVATLYMDVQNTPPSTTNLLPYRLTGRTPDFEFGNLGSNPNTVAKEYCTSGRETMRGIANPVLRRFKSGLVLQFMGAHVPRGRRCFANIVWSVRLTQAFHGFRPLDSKAVLI